MRTSAFIRWLVWGFILLGVLGMTAGLGIMPALGGNPAAAPREGPIFAPMGANKIELRIDRQTGDVDVWITASRSFVAEWTGRLDGEWFPFYDLEIRPGTTHLIRVRHQGWAKTAHQAFYRLRFTGPPNNTSQEDQ